MANQYVDLTHTAAEVDSSISTVTTHVADSVIHVSLSDRQSWDAKQSALTFDAEPTASSTNPVYSGGVYTALTGKADALQETIDRNALAIVIDSGAKNRANPLAAEGYSGQGTYPIERAKVTFTLNANGTITASTDPGVPSSATTTLKIPVTLKAGETYMISGCPAGGSDSTYRIDIRLAGTSTVKAYDYGSGATFTAEQVDYDMCIRYPSGKTAAETFSPMICLSALYAISPAFVPFVPSMAELYAMIQPL